MTHLVSVLGLAWIGSGLVGCGESSSTGRPSSESDAGAGVASGGGSAGVPSGGAGGAAPVGGASAGAPQPVAPDAPEQAALDAPDEELPLLAFLAGREYADWAKEADYHPSAGPHGGGVRVYYSPRAAEALLSGAATFPAGAATVKELTSAGNLYGHAVWVKVQDDSDGGKGFFWYEIIRHGGGNDTVYGNALGSGECVGCHRAGMDYDLSTLPFE